jgi:hypothetical protein
MATAGGTIHDGELTIWNLGSRTTVGYFPVNDVVALNWAIQVTVSGLTGGGKQAVFDFEGSLDGVNWGHLTVVTKHAGASTISADGTVVYYIQNQPNQYMRLYLVTLTSSSTATVSAVLGAM